MIKQKKKHGGMARHDKTQLKWEWTCQNFKNETNEYSMWSCLIEFIREPKGLPLKSKS